MLACCYDSVVAFLFTIAFFFSRRIRLTISSTLSCARMFVFVPALALALALALVLALVLVLVIVIVLALIHI